MLADVSPTAFANGMIGKPLAMAPDPAAAAFAALSALNAAALSTRPVKTAASADRPYELAGGVATIGIFGQLINRATAFSDRLGLASCDGIRAALKAAIADPMVTGVELYVDSPGGDLAGAVETAAAVRAADAIKPIVAFIDGSALSAAYVIAAGARRIVVAPSATVGSIGVVFLHLDTSGELAARGVKPTILHAGARKVDGSRLKPLSADAEKHIQAHIAAAHDLLLASVGAHRPILGAAGARATEAGVYMGQKAVAAGLADSVGTRDNARAWLIPATAPSAFVPSSPPSSLNGVRPMSTPMPAPQPVSPPAPVSPYAIAPEAARRAARHAQRVAEANATVARQLGGKSADELWSETLAKTKAAAGRLPGAALSEAAAPPAPTSTKSKAAQTIDEMWTEALARNKSVSAISGVYR